MLNRFQPFITETIRRFRTVKPADYEIASCTYRLYKTNFAVSFNDISVSVSEDEMRYSYTPAFMVALLCYSFVCLPVMTAVLRHLVHSAVRLGIRIAGDTPCVDVMCLLQSCVLTVTLRNVPVGNVDLIVTEFGFKSIHESPAS